MMKILIVGASSYVGARIFYDLRDSYEVAGTYFANRLAQVFIELDITRKDQVYKTIRTLTPEVIIHSANSASSKWCEENPEEAVLLNQTATEYIVDAANEIGSKFIYISTLATVNPTNLYGETKLASESATRKAKAGYLILRPSLILGYSPNTSNDRPFNRILRNLDEGTPAVYENAWNFQPTCLGHISEVIKECIDRGIWNDTIDIVVPEMTTRYDAARDILAPYGIEVEVEKTAKPYFKDFEVKLDSLMKYNLPLYSYEEMIRAISTELKEREKYRI
jgi:dTDP-4-dehydrorhamnose reductase